MTIVKRGERGAMSAWTVAVIAVWCGCSSASADERSTSEDDVPATGGAPVVHGYGGALPIASGGASGSTPGTGGIGANLGTGGAGGRPPPASTARPYDPTESVSFDWPDTLPDGGAACQAGRYVGTFTCNFVPAGADAGAAPSAFPITGPIEITLLESANGEFLEVTGGTLTGGALIAITFTAKMSGTLDCASGSFDGQVYDGSYGIQPFPPGGFFQGPTTATYSATGPSLANGVWDFTVQTVDGVEQGACVGTWTATYTP